MCTPGVCPGQVTNSTQIEQPEQSLVYLLLGIFLACNILGLALTAAILPGLDKRLVRVKQLWFWVLKIYKMYMNICFGVRLT